ncbi:hypothetical protein CN633_31895, partial [Bacillus toyonensis]
MSGRLGRQTVVVAALAGAMALATPCRAAPEEIQVYMDEMDQPGHFGLDTHINDVTAGTPTDEYPGQQQALHR